MGLSPRSDVSDDYLAGASPQMSEDDDAAEIEDNPPDNMPESSHPSFIVSATIAASVLQLFHGSVYLALALTGWQPSERAATCSAVLVTWLLWLLRLLQHYESCYVR